MTARVEVHAARLTAQLLSGPPAGSVERVVRRILAVQAQDLRGARLAVRARSTGLTSGCVDRALADGAVVVDWLCRGTLHLVHRDDHAWLHALTTPQLVVGNARRLREEGISAEDAERGVAAVVRALAAGPRTREQLREAVASAGVPVAGQALVHVLFLASLRGHVVRGPVVGATQAFVLARDWLGRPPPVDRDAALAELTRRYLTGHGPATDRDLARWAGLPLRDVRRGLALAAPQVVEVGAGLVDLAVRDPAAPLPPPRLLGSFEPVLLGWTSRDDVVGPEKGLVTVNGVFRPFAIRQGRAVATWTLDRGRVAVTPFTPLDDGTSEALDEDGRAVVRWLAG